MNGKNADNNGAGMRGGNRDGKHGERNHAGGKGGDGDCGDERKRGGGGERNHAGAPCGGYGRGHGGVGRGAHMHSFMEICLLVLLYKDTCHGYNLAEKLGGFGLTDVNVSTLYRTLRKMDAQGWVKSDWEQSESGPKRRVYTITDSGKSELGEKAKMLEQRKSRIETVLERYKSATEE